MGKGIRHKDFNLFGNSRVGKPAIRIRDAGRIRREAGIREAESERPESESREAGIRMDNARTEIREAGWIMLGRFGIRRKDWDVHPWSVHRTDDTGRIKA